MVVSIGPLETPAPPSSAGLPAWPGRLTCALGSYAVAVGVSTLVGWALDVPRLTNWKDDGISMFPNTAVAAVLAGLALVLANALPRWAAAIRVLGVGASLIGALTLFEHLSGVDLGIDTLLFERSWGQAAAAAPMRMGPPASVSFLLAGVALALLSAGPNARRASVYLGLVVTTLAVTPLTGHLYGASPMYTVPLVTAISMQTATAVAALGIGLLASVPEREPMRTFLERSAAGALVQRAFPVIVALSFCLGAVRLYLQEVGLVDTAFGTALRTVWELALFTALLWWAAARVRSHEQDRRLGAAIVEASDDAIVSKTLDGVITSWNRGAERIFGYTAAEAIGQPVTMLIPIERHDEEPGILARIRRGEPIEHYETVRRRKDGTLLEISLTVSPIRDSWGNVVGASKIARDITERNLALARVARDREVTLRLYDIGKRCQRPHVRVPDMLADMLEAAVWIARADRGIIQLHDDATGELRIAAQSGFEPRFLDFFGVVDRERAAACTAEMTGDRLVVEDVLASPLFAGQPSLQVLLDAHVRALQSTPLVSSGGTVLGIMSTHWARPHRPTERECRMLDLLARQAADYIERKRGEEQREALLRIAERARDDAEAANRAKDEFLAMLGHELRNPLAAVRNAITAATLDDASRGRALAIASRQTNQLGRIVDDLLDVARITQGRVRLRKERVSLVALLQRAAEGARAMLEERGHAFTLTVPREDILLDADAGRLDQAVGNLLTNAAKYTNPGGSVTLSAGRENGDAVIRVRDTGIGIAPEFLPKVFELFAQSDRSLDRAPGGLGIGLTLVRRIVEMHGGTVIASSAGLGAGAEFALRLPALPAALAESASGADQMRRPSEQHPARVLMIEDNPDGAESLRMLLELLGHHVRVVHDGAAGLEAARANVPDVVLVDIGLPGMNGYQVAEAMRREPALRHLVLVALTGYGRPEDREQAMAAGFDYHLVKPVDLDALGDLVARLGGRAGEPGGRTPTRH